MIPHRPRIRNLLCTLPLLLGCPLTLSIQPSNAASVGKVRVMDVDDVRDAATIARTKARNRSESAENGESFGGGAFSSGCSDMNIGNVKGGVGNSVPRNVTIVIEGPVIQENNCR